MTVRVRWARQGMSDASMVQWLIVEMVWMEGERGESKKKHQPNTHELIDDAINGHRTGGELGTVGRSHSVGEFIELKKV